MLRSEELLDLDITCEVNTTAGEFFCARVNEIRLDVTALVDLVEPILDKFVNAEEDGILDRVAIPILPLEEPIPGLSDLAGEDIAILDIAEIFQPQNSGVKTARTFLKFYRGLKQLSETFGEADEDGIVLADYCQFKPGQGLKCSGGATGLLH